MRDEPEDRSVDLHVLDQFEDPTRNLLVQALLYKTVFLAPSFRALASREEPQVRDALLQISHETAAEATALTGLVGAWDREDTSFDAIRRCTHDMRRRLLQDLVGVKEGLTETGLAMAMAQRSAEKREHFLKLVDADRKHGDVLRKLLDTPVTRDFATAIDNAEAVLGAHGGRDASTSLSGTIQRRLDAMRKQEFTPSRLVVGPDGARHLRDERVITRKGTAFGLHLDVDMAWQGDAFAIESEERLSYSEIVSAHAAHGDGGGA